jgi:RNA polymerase sigma-70 factor (ECF subfamily)
MKSASPPEITGILREWTAGDPSALERLTPLVVDELYRLARRYMVGERHPLTLETAALVNEAFLRLVDIKRIDWRDRVHFFAMSATLMRQILVDFARKRRSGKRGGELVRIPVEDLREVSGIDSADLVDLDEALRSLAKLDERQSRVVELRFFGGLTVEETATVLGVSPGTVRRDWRLARAWLFRELTSGTASATVQPGRNRGGGGCPE